MGITVKPKIEEPEENIEISADDAGTIERIATHCGKIDAMKATRWLTGCRLLTAKRFVDMFDAR